MKKRDHVRSKEKRYKKLSDKKYIDIVDSFHASLRKEQLSDDELKKCFKRHNHAWVKVCCKYSLNIESRAAFAKEVAGMFKAKEKV